MTDIVGNDSTVSQIQKNINNGIDVLTIGLGQAGGKMAYAIKKYCTTSDKNTIVINMSSKDLNAMEIPDSMKMKIGKYEGAGQNRDLSKSLFKDKVEGDYFASFLETYGNILFKENRVIIVPFSTSGGTGSGIGPWFIARLTKHISSYQGTIMRQMGDGTLTPVEISPRMRPIVIGMAILPSLKSNVEGVKALQNTLEALKELNTLVENKAISLMLVDNDNSDLSMDKDIAGLYADVNDRIAKTIYRFFKIFGESDIKSLDLSDRLNALALPGFTTLYTMNGSQFNKNPFLLPENANFKRLLAELPEENTVEITNKLEALLKSRILKYADSRIGFIRTNIAIPENKLTEDETYRPIALLSGLDSISKITEPYARRLESLLEKQETMTRTIQETGTGFENIATTKEKLNKENKQEISDDLLDSI